MNQQEFASEVLNGARDDYVSEEALEYLAENADFRVISRSAMEKGEVEQTEFISVASASDMTGASDGELIDKVMEKMVDGSRDVQKYQMRDDGEAPNTVEIWRHGSGYSAFAYAE